MSKTNQLSQDEAETIMRKNWKAYLNDCRVLGHREVSFEDWLVAYADDIEGREVLLNT